MSRRALRRYIKPEIEDEDGLIDPETGARPAQAWDAMQTQFDVLADVMEECLDVGLILRIMGLEDVPT